jgi:hypothetical protein
MPDCPYCKAKLVWGRAPTPPAENEYRYGCLVPELGGFMDVKCRGCGKVVRYRDGSLEEVLEPAERATDDQRTGRPTIAAQFATGFVLVLVVGVPLAFAQHGCASLKPAIAWGLLGLVAWLVSRKTTYAPLGRGVVAGTILVFGLSVVMAANLAQRC